MSRSATRRHSALHTTITPAQSQWLTDHARARERSVAETLRSILDDAMARDPAPAFSAPASQRIDALAPRDQREAEQFAALDEEYADIIPKRS